MTRPAIIEKLNTELLLALEADDKPDIPADKVADIFGLDKVKFRNMIYSGNVPFAIGTEGGKYGRGYCKIPKLALWYWVTGESRTV
jgi:hypothetical protein